MRALRTWPCRPRARGEVRACSKASCSGPSAPSCGNFAQRFTSGVRCFCTFTRRVMARKGLAAPRLRARAAGHLQPRDICLHRRKCGHFGPGKTEAGMEYQPVGVSLCLQCVCRSWRSGRRPTCR